MRDNDGHTMPVFHGREPCAVTLASYSQDSASFLHGLRQPAYAEEPLDGKPHTINGDLSTEGIYGPACPHHG